MKSYPQFVWEDTDCGVGANVEFYEGFAGVGGDGVGRGGWAFAVCGWKDSCLGLLGGLYISVVGTL